LKDPAIAAAYLNYIVLIVDAMSMDVVESSNLFCVADDGKDTTTAGTYISSWFHKLIFDRNLTYADLLLEKKIVRSLKCTAKVVQANK
jgi:CobQ-like glutamine amidotransferase family enzyme